MPLDGVMPVSKQRMAGRVSSADSKAPRETFVTGNVLIPSRAIHFKVLAGWFCSESYFHKLSCEHEKHGMYSCPQAVQDSMKNEFAIQENEFVGQPLMLG